MFRRVALWIAIVGTLGAGCVAPVGPADTPAPAIGGTPSPAPSMTAPATVEPTEAAPALSPLRIMAAPAIDDLSGRLGVPADSIEVTFAAEIEWPDASLGCPAPDFAYAQVLTNGMKVTLRVGAATYDYHGRSPDSLFLCGANGPVPPGEIP